MSMLPQTIRNLPCIEAPLAYLAEDACAASYRVWPLTSGREPESPRKAYYPCRIFECRSIAIALSLDKDGFVFCSHTTTFSAFLDDVRVKSDYYPELEAFLKALTGAKAVFVFDHNVRSASGAALGQVGVRAPVDMVHGDYSGPSGARRCREVLQTSRYAGLTPSRTMLINAWRPLRGPVLDLPLALCHAPSVALTDLVATPIQHYGEGELEVPRHSGEILSVKHNPAHRWFYASSMQADEVLVFKGYDSNEEVASRFTPHTGFVHPDRPARFVPRESIEVRAIVIDPALETSP